MRHIDSGEELIDALNPIVSFESLQRSHDRVMQWSNDVIDLAGRVGVASPHPTPALNLEEESRSDMVAALRREVTARLAWLNGLVNSDLHRGSRLPDNWTG
jgi:hypothetical protein